MKTTIRAPRAVLAALICLGAAPALAQNDAEIRAPAMSAALSTTPTPSLGAGAQSEPAPAAQADSNPAPATAAPAKPRELRIDETGIATYYAPDMAGQVTASGERYDPAALTAAHRTHPIGTVLRVVDLEGGRTVRVRINDRWGGGNGRVINLSRRAADEIGFGRAGQMRVALIVELVGSGPVGTTVRVGERMPAPLDSASSPRQLVCQNQGRILGLRDAFLRNHVANCMQRASR